MTDQPVASSSADDRARLRAALRGIREGRHLTQRAAATALGWRPGTLSEIETGRRCPAPDRVRQLLDLYGIGGAAAHDLLTLARRARVRRRTS